MTRRIRALIVDDSKVIQMLIADHLKDDPRLEIFGNAFHPLEAFELLKNDKPDVIILDIEMPHMDGFQFLAELKKKSMMIPTLVFTSKIKDGTDLAIRAMESGALHLIEKPHSVREFNSVITNLKEKLVEISKIKLDKPLAVSRTHRISAEQTFLKNKIFLIGSSTGGVGALSSILPEFPKHSPPILIVQHMPEGFTKGFAERMDNLCPMRVIEPENNQLIEPGHIYIAPGGDEHMLAVSEAGELRIFLKKDEKVNGHRPSVDVLFKSFVGSKTVEPIVLVMTGMGADGALGMKELSARTKDLFVQSESTSVVYGMPKVALEYSPNASVVGLEEIPEKLLERAKR